MKNAIIAAALTYIFYTDLCVVKIPAAIPFIALIFWVIIAETDEVIQDFKRTVRRGEKLQTEIRKMRRRAKWEI